ncbi:MAG: hypothetical protein ACPGUV_10820 [Polyangiales bacterium]
MHSWRIRISWTAALMLALCAPVALSGCGDDDDVITDGGLTDGSITDAGTADAGDAS